MTAEPYSLYVSVTNLEPRTETRFWTLINNTDRCLATPVRSVSTVGFCSLGSSAGEARRARSLFCFRRVAALPQSVQPPPAAVTGLKLSPRVKRRPCHPAPPAHLHSVRSSWCSSISSLRLATLGTRLVSSTANVSTRSCTCLYHTQ